MYSSRTDGPAPGRRKRKSSTGSVCCLSVCQNPAGWLMVGLGLVKPSECGRNTCPTYQPNCCSTTLTSSSDIGWPAQKNLSLQSFNNYPCEHWSISLGKVMLICQGHNFWTSLGLFRVKCCKLGSLFWKMQQQSFIDFQIRV